MKLKPTTRQFLWSAGAAALFFIVVMGRFMWQFFRATGADDDVAMQGFLIDGALFGLVLVLGIGAAWIRLLRDRKARRDRKPPLSMG